MQKSINDLTDKEIQDKGFVVSILRVVSDCHGKTDEYMSLINAPEIDYSVQVGDLGFNYNFLRYVDYNRHFFLQGNHDNADIINDAKSRPKHNLGDYGSAITAAGHKFFFVRGAASIDAMWRVQQFIKTGVKSWWYEEELDYHTMKTCKKEYIRCKPEVMITHDCPRVVNRMITNPIILKNFGWNKNHLFRTTQFLQDLFEAHKPRLHIFGHYHKHFDKVIDGCRFICLPEIGYKDFDENWNEV